MRARKRFGQHFLSDESVLQHIVNCVNLAPQDRVMEIGPGRGALTDLLAGQAQEYRAVEIDRDLVPFLQARHPSVEVINADILSADLNQILSEGTPWRVIGNLPYNISSPLLAVITSFITEHPQRIADLHFMLQKEMAQRLTAQPGSKAWGRLSVMVQLRFSVELLFDVGPESFTPPPKVDSSVIRMLPLDEPIGVDPARLDHVLRLAFAGRRKRLSNSLKSLNIDWSQMNLDPGKRADDVTLAQFVALTDLIDSAPQGETEIE